MPVVGKGIRFRINGGEEITESDALERLLGIYDGAHPEPNVITHGNMPYKDVVPLIESCRIKRGEVVESVTSRLSEYAGAVGNASK